jgi:iron complex transport system permease protein
MNNLLKEKATFPHPLNSSLPLETPGLGRAEQLKFRVLFSLLLITLLVSITLAVIIGPVEIPALQVWQIALSQFFPALSGDWSQAQFNIVWLIRFPRVLLALFVGAGLSVVGVAMQALVRNPLADPYILGISSGASAGAVLALATGLFAFAGLYALSIGAFAGALLAFLLVFLLAQANGRLSPIRLVLSGVAIAYLFSGLTSFIILTAGERDLARAVLAWLLGSLSGAAWPDLSLPAAVLAAGVAYLVLQARALNALIVGEETAITLGLDTARFRRRLFLIVSLLTGVMVAVSGAIGFVGLMLPHMVRLAVGADHRRVLPISLLLGSIFLIWVDVAARTLFDPVELPLGVITSLFGAPFFLWLMRRQMRSGGG